MRNRTNNRTNKVKLMEDKCNKSNDGELLIFDGHYSAKECKDIISFETYDEPSDYSNNVRHTYIKKGIVWFEGERFNGWTEQYTYKKGRIKATAILTLDEEQRVKEIKSKLKEHISD